MFLNPERKNEKFRGDHRHHAVDATVVALTSPSLLQRASSLSKQENSEELTKLFSKCRPDSEFEREFETRLSSIIASHAETRRIMGALHEETAFGPTEDPNAFVHRVGIETLTKSQLEGIRDMNVKRILLERLERFGGDLKKAFSNLENDPIFHSDGKTPIKTVRTIEVKARTSVLDYRSKGTTFFAYGNNHHLELLEERNPKSGKEAKREGVVITTFEATRRTAEKRPLINID